MTETDRPRVLMVTRFDPFAPRPQPLQALWAADGLARAGARVTLLMDAQGSAPPERGAVEAYLGRTLHPRLDLRFAAGRHPGVRGVRRRWIAVSCLRAGIDAVLTREVGITAQLARLRPLGLGAPIVHEWHALPSALGQKDEGEARAVELADAQIFVSPGLRRVVEELHGLEGPAIVLDNGCHPDPESAQRALDGLPVAQRVLCASMGRGPADDRLLDRITALPEHLELVRAVGRLTPAELADRMPGCLCQLALYVDDLNTRRFASPLKVVQALASGVPLVASDLPTVRRYVVDGESALLVPPGDPSALSDALLRLDRDRGLAHRLARTALDRAPDWSWTRRGERLLALLESL